MTGTGVVFINMDDQWADPSEAECGAIEVQSGAQVQITPPTSGDYAGLLIYQASDCTEDIEITSATLGAAGGPPGAIYAPSAPVHLIGGGTFGAVVVAQSIEIDGGVFNFNANIPSSTAVNGPYRLSQNP